MATGRQRWANPHHSAKLQKCSIPEGVGTSSSFQEEPHSRFWCQGQVTVMVGHQTHQPPAGAGNGDDWPPNPPATWQSEILNSTQDEAGRGCGEGNNCLC